MSVLITSDLHFSSTPRDSYRFRIFDELGVMVRSRSILHLYVLGDLTEEKDNHNAELVNKIVDGFVRLSNKVPITIIRGNHDGLDQENPFFRFLRYFESISWVNSPTPAEFMSFDDGSELNCLFLPHSSNYIEDWKKFDLKSYDLILAHNTFKGAKLESGFEPKGSIPISIFHPDTIVISGDIHTPQTVGPVRYVGAPYTIDFGDEYEPRVLVIKDDLRIESVGITLPQKILIRVPSLEALYNLPDYAVMPGDVLKIEFDPKDHQNMPRMELIDQARKWGEERECWVYTVATVPRKTKRRSGEAIDPFTRSPKSDEKVFTEYAERNELEDRIVRTGRMLMKKASA